MKFFFIYGHCHIYAYALSTKFPKSEVYFFAPEYFFILKENGQLDREKNGISVGHIFVKIDGNHHDALGNRGSNLGWLRIKYGISLLNKKVSKYFLKKYCLLFHTESELSHLITMADELISHHKKEGLL